MKYVILLAVVLGLTALSLYGSSFGPAGRDRDVRSEVMSKPPSGYHVEIREKGRYGEILYSENDKSATFGWEFGANVLCIIDIPSESLWMKELEFPVSRRKEIAERLAREVIRQKAPKSSFRWTGNMIQITN